jgi:cobalt transporter subunit CbtA
MQQLGIVPLILAAEVYEQAAEPAAHGHDASEAAAHEEAGGWAPADGVARTAFTVVANVLTGVGFALLLVASFALTGRDVGWREGLFWGLGGFIAFMLAPSLGLPPELPGMPAAELGPRQLWWVTTVGTAAAALFVLAFRRSPPWAALAIVLLVAPHLVGAPQPPEATSAVPESLERHFVVAVTVTSFLFWTLLGVASAVLFQRIGRVRTALQG